MENAELPTMSAKVIIDGVFYQIAPTGIARVWTTLMEVWAAGDFGKQLLLLDRANTAPTIPGIRTRIIPAFDYSRADADRAMLQAVCDEEAADVFASTYYTTPLSTPSVFMAHDMIPELFGWDLNHPMWREKHRGLGHASAIVCVSESTRHDLLRYFPNIPADKITVAPLAAAKVFHPRPQAEVEYVRRGVGIERDYFLTVGARGGYKNTRLTFSALASLSPAELDSIDILCAGHVTLEAEFQAMIPGKSVKAFNLSDDELAAAYTGAAALLHPSAYEGFGLPVIEAMACSCPVIATSNGALAEVGGDAALRVGADDVEAMVHAMRQVRRPGVREELARKGLEQAGKFSWEKTAGAIRNVLEETPRTVRFVAGR